MRPEPPWREVFTHHPEAAGRRVVSENFPEGWLWPHSPEAEVYKLSPEGEVFTHGSLLFGYVFQTIQWQSFFTVQVCCRPVTNADSDCSSRVWVKTRADGTGSLPFADNDAGRSSEPNTCEWREISVWKQTPRGTVISNMQGANVTVFCKKGLPLYSLILYPN